MTARLSCTYARALAHAASGELDHACQLTTQAMPDIQLADSATVRTDLRRHTPLARWHTHPAVRELHPLITTALYTPINRP